MNINFSLLFFFSILFLFFCSSSSSILHPISLSTRQEREVEKRRKKDKEEKREKRSREKLIVVSLHSLSYFILLCFFYSIFLFPSQLSNASWFLSFLQFDSRWFGRYAAYSLVSPIVGSLFHRREPQRRIFSLASKFKMAYSERLLENQERLSMRNMRLRVAKLILRGVASSTIAQAEGYPSYTARELSSYFSYSSISIVVNLNLNQTTISSPGLRRGHVKKNAFHVKGVGEIVNQTVKSDRAIAPLLKTNNSTEGRQVEIS